MKKIIINLFFIMFTLLFASKSYAQCTSCDVTLNSGGNTLTLAENRIYCIDGNVSFSDISWANNTTICIPSGSKLTINNNMHNNVNANTVNFEIYGELQFGNPQFAVNVNMNIHPNGKYKSTGNTVFSGSEVNINNQSGTFEVAVLDLTSNSGKVKIINSNSATFTTNNNLNVGGNVSLYFNNEGTLEVGAQFGLSANSSYSNCGTINTQGFNIQGGTIYNTGTMNISDKLEGSGNIFNYSILNIENILGSGKIFHNSGRIEVSGSVADMTIYGPNDLPKYGEFIWKGPMSGLNSVIVYGNQLFTNSNGTSSQSEMFQNPSALQPQTGSNIAWAPCPSCVVETTTDQCIDSETGQPVEVCEEEIFFEDFGTSDLNDGNYGRKVSPYMPSGSFAFGTPYPTSTNYNEYMIDNNHYAVVAPGYIKAGTDPNQYYFWTPAYNEANTVTDRSGTEEGAVMVINAGTTLLPFYQREYTVESNTTYRASFWLYLVNGPSKVAIDVINKTTGEVLGTVESELMEDWNTTYKGQWTQHTLHFATPEITPDCNLSNVIISIRNAHEANFGNDYYIDDIKFSKLVCDIPTEGVVEIKCPSTTVCYKPANLIANGGLNTEIGISSLRLENTNGWPQVREGAWIALESKTKGFVPNRLSNAQIAAIPSANLVSGMMVYNTDEDCLQINVDGTEDGWKCFDVQGCLE